MSADAPANPPMPPEELRAIAQRLYGRYGWQTRLARDLDRDPRVVRRWAAGDTGIPPDTRQRIRGLQTASGETSAHSVLARMADVPDGWTVRRTAEGLIAERRGPDGTPVETHWVRSAPPA